MSNIVWTKIDQEDAPSSVSIVFLDSGDSIVIQENHANYKQILHELIDEEEGFEERVRSLSNVAVTIGQRFSRLSDRVTADDRNVYFDGDAIESVIASHIIRLLNNEGESGTSSASSWRALVNFLEKVYQNPVESSRESLYTFIEHYGLTIRNDGDFIAYKGLQDDLTSVHSGVGIVNDVSCNGHLDNSPGNVVEIPRSMVEKSREIGCAVGLHAGAMEYASSFGTRVVAVAVNPRDVVSVPHDCQFQKLRIARYEVLCEVEKTDRRATYGEESDLTWDEDDWDDEWDPYGDDCDSSEDCDCEGCDGSCEGWCEENCGSSDDFEDDDCDEKCWNCRTDESYRNSQDPVIPGISAFVDEEQEKKEEESEDPVKDEESTDSVPYDQIASYQSPSNEHVCLSREDVTGFFSKTIPGDTISIEFYDGNTFLSFRDLEVLYVPRDYTYVSVISRLGVEFSIPLNKVVCVI